VHVGRDERTMGQYSMAWNDEEIGDHGTTAGRRRPDKASFASHIASQAASQPFSDY